MIPGGGTSGGVKGGNVVVANSGEFAGAGGMDTTHSRPMESLTLNFTKITYNTVTMDPTHATGKPDRASWDLAQGKGA